MSRISYSSSPVYAEGNIVSVGSEMRIRTSLMVMVMATVKTRTKHKLDTSVDGSGGERFLWAAEEEVTSCRNRTAVAVKTENIRERWRELIHLNKYGLRYVALKFYLFIYFNRYPHIL